MRKICATLFAAMLSVFALNALPNLHESIGLDSLVENYTATSDSVIQRMDVITAKVDSVHTQMKSDSEKNWLWWDIDLSNVWIALVGLIVGILGYRASKKTADNVKRASSNVQNGQLNDLIRHLYRNLVCTLAFSQKVLEESNNRRKGNAIGKIINALIGTKAERKEYPSEEHLLKLKVLPEDVLHLEKYNNSPTIYQKMHELKLLLRNYDVEVDTALMHLKDKGIKPDVIKNDLNTLAYKPLHLIDAICTVRGIKTSKQRIFHAVLKTARKIMPFINADKNGFENAAAIMTQEHISKLIKWDKKENNEFDATKYRDLNEKLNPPQQKMEITKPYGGLKRSWNLLRKDAVKESQKRPTPDNVSYKERFVPHEKDYDPVKYNAAIEKVCERVKELTAFKGSITSDEDFSFNEHFLTMLSIDVTIELNNIHMIKLD